MFEYKVNAQRSRAEKHRLYNWVPHEVGRHLIGENSNFDGVAGVKEFRFGQGLLHVLHCKGKVLCSVYITESPKI